MKRQRFAWVTIGPTVWLAICTLTAGYQKLFDPRPAISFLAHRSVFAQALADGKLLAPARSVVDMQAIVLNDTVDAAICALFVAVVLAMIIYGVMAMFRGLANPRPSAQEIAHDLQMVR
jgi:carbon starvation protein